MLELLDHAFGFFCGQNPGHTWAPGGVPLPFCQRCTGLYAGAAAALLLHLGFRPELNGRFLKVHGAFLLAMVPLGFHWIEHGPLLRTASGLLFGAGLVAFLGHRFWRGARSRRLSCSPMPGGSNPYFPGLGIALILILYASSRGGAPAGPLLTGVGVGGALGLLGLAGANALSLLLDLIGLARRRWAPR